MLHMLGPERQESDIRHVVQGHHGDVEYGVNAEKWCKLEDKQMPRTRTEVSNISFVAACPKKKKEILFLQSFSRQRRCCFQACRFQGQIESSFSS